MDCLEMINRSQWFHVVDDIYQQHPERANKKYGAKRLASRTKIDYSNPQEWAKDQLVLAEVDIAGCCMRGRHRAAILLLESGLFESSEINFQSIENDGACILKPRGSRVGVSHTEYDWSLVEDGVLEEGNSVNTIDDLIPVPASIVDSIVMVDGKSFHKATVTRQMLSTERVSGDRLKRVRGFSKFEPNSVTDEGSLAETLVEGPL